MAVAQTGIAERLTISEREAEIVAGILGEHVPDRAVWAFGSRATGRRVKRFSDLDLAVSGQLTWAQRAALSEAFDEALLNFKVDVVESAMVDEEFWARIEKDFVVLQTAP
jgi:predicted nucleotidyltransferase